MPPFKPLALALAAALVPAAAGLVAGQAWLASHNTLAANGGWEATKTHLARGVIGALAFVTERQTPAGGVLHLGAWHGFHEVTRRGEPGPLTRLEFSFLLTRGAWLVATVDHAPDGSALGIRLSRPEDGRAEILSIRAGGAHAPLAVLRAGSLRTGQRHRARIDLGRSELVVSVDGDELGRIALAGRSGRSDLTFGFRGGARDARIDDVVARTAAGRTIRDGFDRPSCSGRVQAGVVLASLVLNLPLYFALLRRHRERPRRAAFALVAANLTLIASAAALWAFAGLSSAWYRGREAELRRAEQYFARGARERVLEEICSRHPPLPAAGATRILFLGSSQTWGAGASQDDDAFLRVLERELDERWGGGYECINGAVSSYRAREVEALLAGELLSLAPHVVVINLASNDRADPGRFADPIDRMIASLRAAGACPVLVKEANAPEATERSLLDLHARLDEIGSRHGVPVVDLHGRLRALAGRGFLLWDKVHLTSFGQRLAAEVLLAELERLGLAGVAPACPAPGA